MRKALTLMTAVFLLLSLTASVLATEPAEQTPADKNWKFLDDDAVRAIIDEVYSPETAGSMFSARKELDSYYIDPSEYILEYSVSSYFLDDFQALGHDFSRLPELMRGIDPAIYIPVYGSVQGQSRVVGHYYIHKSTNGYTGTPVLVNVTSQDFLDGSLPHFYEQLQKSSLCGALLL